MELGNVVFLIIAILIFIGLVKHLRKEVPENKKPQKLAITYTILGLIIIFLGFVIMNVNDQYIRSMIMIFIGITLLIVGWVTEIYLR